MSDARVAVLKALGHPLRLRVVDRLGHVGPAPVSALAAELDASLPDVSAALRVLRSAGLVSVAREGRSSVYALTAGVDLVLPWLDRVVGAGPAPASARPRVSRTCYGHLGGPLGVSLYRWLVARGALVAGEDGVVTVVREDELRSLGVESVEIGRQRLAFECLDATEHAPHLAGALGDALAAALFERGWIERAGDGREVTVVDGRLERMIAGDER
ncbi:metalloregulator ArsR/SmtB family transcription factor [Solirubrobacter phytolaccae]|uniref:Metalloregulator ArsR/SmtB family transcription factor n=1 Tax=Solirubrobacter phytolaccae TaxID=1404360 RepID=A0A9X3N4W2_9ACTN|nr:metalloregulator ArsR/SmtB family transcription factor [Solirubrobacter phytolaccae]MDA0179684.1 metalloregulator ArsR/SmtB family transcription factor [Solirubrobacter phytolaccae]